MFDFDDVKSASKEERVRAWAVEQSVDVLRSELTPYQDVIVLAKMIEDYVVNGDVTGVIQAAVEEGYSEGRFEVKEEVERWFTNVDLYDLFASKGWTRSVKSEDNTAHGYIKGFDKKEGDR